MAIFKLLEEKLLRQTDYMSLFNTFRTELQCCQDSKQLTRIAFTHLNPFPQKLINTKRERHQRVVEVGSNLRQYFLSEVWNESEQAQMESLEVIRQDYRKNSVISLKSAAPSDEEDD